MNANTGSVNLPGKGIRSSSFLLRNEADKHSMALPPHGVFVPGQLISHPRLTAAALATWVQLRSLAWDGWSTPPITLPELAAQLGLHPGRLSRHLALLQDVEALTWRDAGSGRLILSFPQQPILLPIPYQDVGSYPYPADTRRLPNDHPGLVSYFPSRILGYLSYEDDHDPLYIDDGLDLPKRVEPVLNREFSRWALCAPAEHSLAGE